MLCSGFQLLDSFLWEELYYTIHASRHLDKRV